MDHPSQYDSTDVFLYISARFQVQLQVDELRLLSTKDLKFLQRSIKKCHVAMFETPRVAYHISFPRHGYAPQQFGHILQESRAALPAQPSALRGEGGRRRTYLTNLANPIDSDGGRTGCKAPHNSVLPNTVTLQFPTFCQTPSLSFSRGTSLLLPDIMSPHFLHRTNSFRPVPISHRLPKISGGSTYWSTDHGSKTTIKTTCALRI